MNALPKPEVAAEVTGPVTELLSGTQAIVRLLVEQRERDAAAGYQTAGFVSGYRGSPLGTLDMALWGAAAQLKAHDIHFQPGVNEELAATSVWGSQYVGKWPGAFPGARVDGVFGLWYGKGPGVDRSGDALKHGNLAGSSPLGGALVLAGDDHAAKSSTTAHQSEQALVAAGIPVLYPADVRDIVHLGLHAYAMSRQSGCWVGLKVVTDVFETTMSVDCTSVGPTTAVAPGVAQRAVRVQDPPKLAEQRLMKEKLPQVLAYAREQGLNRLVADPAGATRGIVSAGKSWSDVLQALELLGLTLDDCATLGLRLWKVDMVWPLDPTQVARFAQGLETALVVEEKRAVLEDQLKAQLYDLGLAPKIHGKRAASPAFGGQSAEVLPAWGEFDPVQVARVIAQWLGLPTDGRAVLMPTAVAAAVAPPRLPSFCSGCPHNTSTRVPEGSRALAGIGCHGMATIKQPAVTTTMSQMGGEGVMWVGQAPFTEEQHVFANIGDGTWFHSGSLALRAAVAAKVNITYKILVNGFVSMTGGQPIDGELSVPSLLCSLQAEGVARAVLVTDEPEKYEGQSLPGRPAVRHRRELDVVQRELRDVRGVTVIVYEQACATERRRLRKRGKWPDPQVRTFINPAVCEGCGDCGKASDCLSIEPLETPFGRKRRINQSSCNKDRTCVDGFCPSFVTVHGGQYKGEAHSAPAVSTVAAPAVPLPLPEPAPAALHAPLNVLFAGVGGTGVVTASAVLVEAAHRQGLHVSTLDVTGLSQKYGAVQSHVRIAPADQALPASRIAPGQAHVLIGCDLLVAGDADVLQRLQPGQAFAVLNSGVSPSADFTRNPDWQSNAQAVHEQLEAATAARSVADASAIAQALLGDAIGANLLLLGMAWQRGWLPVARQHIEAVIAARGGAKTNLRAFELGRRAAHDPAWASACVEPAPQTVQFLPSQPRTLTQWMRLHEEQLQAYQPNGTVARRYRARIEAIAKAEQAAGLGEQLGIAAARGYYKLLAHKDEYEVARLITTPGFREQLERQFEGPVSLHLHLGGGALAKHDAVTGKPMKTELKGWIWPALRVLSKVRGVRGTWLDPWRNNAERQLAREWRRRYEGDLDAVLAALQRRPGAAEHAALLRLAKVPDQLRGYGHVREASAVNAMRIRGEALAACAELVDPRLAA